ncbi:hypothetical protein B7463_g9017, partial [Scytalidium lignicola]
MSLFTDYCSFLNVKVNVDTTTIVIAYHTKSRKIDLQEEKSSDVDSINYYRKLLADAYEVLTDSTKREEYNYNLQQAKSKTNTQEDKLRCFVHKSKYMESSYEPRRIFPRHNKRELGGLQKRFFHRGAHHQLFEQYKTITQYSHPNMPSNQSVASFTKPSSQLTVKGAVKSCSNSSSLSISSTKVINVTSDKALLETYLRTKQSRDYWHEVLELCLTQRQYLQEQLSFAEQGIIPQGHEDLFESSSTKQCVLASIIRCLNAQGDGNLREDLLVLLPGFGG